MRVIKVDKCDICPYEGCSWHTNSSIPPDCPLPKLSDVVAKEVARKGGYFDAETA